MESKQSHNKGRKLWYIVTAAFLVLIAAWTTLIIVATKNKPEIVELESE